MLATATSFETAWIEASKVEGWLSIGEARLLFESAIVTPEDATIVEVGSFWGKSTRILASTGRKLYTIDPLPAGGRVAHMRITTDAINAMESVVRNYPNVTWIRKKREDAPIPPEVSMIFIDANHIYPAPKDDFLYFEPVLSKDAVIAFHDYESNDIGVTQAVNELIAEWKVMPVRKVGSMFIGRKGT